MTTVNLVDELFDRLDKWRHLPAYQLERRADIFFAIYLNDIIKGKFKEEIQYIIPEFPVRLGNVYSNKTLNNPNLSFKIDYVAISNKAKKVFLIELKTDNSSRREKQDWYLERAKENNINNLISGVLDICKATSSKKKYANLISLLAEIGWVDPGKMKNKSHDYDIEIVYIQPTDDEKGKTVIKFEDIVSYLSYRKDNLTQRFIKSLAEWSSNPNI